VEVVTLTLYPLYSLEGAPSIEYEPWWALEVVWTFLERDIS
jgi:hypothetical protein